MCNFKKLARSHNRLKWDMIDWVKIKKRISRVQHRIFKARLDGKMGTVHNLQVRLINSLDGKLLSVRNVTNINSINEHTNVLSPEQKVTFAYRLKVHEKTPFSQLSLKKQVLGKKLRNVHYNYLKDQVKQNLIRLALEPEYEAIFKADSYNCRPGRYAYDALQAVHWALRKEPCHVIIIDLSNCFIDLNENNFLKNVQNVSVIKRHIKNWVSQNVISDYLISREKSLYELEMTTNYKGKNNCKYKIAPLLINRVVHNLSVALKQYVTQINKLNFGGNKVFYPKVQIIQNLTQVLIICSNRPLVEKLFKKTPYLISLQGLDPSLVNREIKNSNEGFTFLGFQVITILKNKTYHVKIQISKQSKLELLSQTRSIIQHNKAASAYTLIKKLTALLIPWAEYFRYFDAPKQFSQIDYKLYSQIRAWVFRRKAQGKNRAFLKEKYFPIGREYIYQGKAHKDNWILVGEEKLPNGRIIENYLPHLRWIKRRDFIKLKYKYSPYNGDYLYWNKRLSFIDDTDKTF